MILTCPACTTRYQADAAKFPAAGRNVRCAKCGHVWHQTPPQPEPEDDVVIAEPAAPPPKNEPVYERPEPQPVEHAPAYDSPQTRPVPVAVPVEEPRIASGVGRRVGLLAGWVAFIGLILVIGWAGLTYRQEIATAWPQASSFYSMIGQPVNTRGIEFVPKPPHTEVDNGQTVLIVSGELRNVSGAEIDVPQKIRVGMTDGQKREIYSWTFTPDVKTLAPGQSAPFTTRMTNPPQEARNLEVRFARDGE